MGEQRSIVDGLPTAVLKCNMPSRELLEKEISHINVVTLVDNIEKELTATCAMLLHSLRASHRSLDGGAIERAIYTANERNGEVPTAGFVTPIQRHGAPRNACGLVDGWFPTTTALTASNDTLAAVDSPTVIVVALLRGESPTAFAEHSIRTNRMPTTTPGYISVPSRAQAALFQPTHVQLLRELFDAGVQDYTAISDTNRADFVTAVHGNGTPSFTVLHARNGATLELHTPEGRPPVLATFPPEHLSHIAWQALAPESRLWVLRGLVEVHAVRAALLDMAPPQTAKLVGMIGGVQLKWYKTGAYCEAVMKTVRRLQFRAVYGEVDGEARWSKWYYGCKGRAGALALAGLGPSPPPPPRLPHPICAAHVRAWALLHSHNTHMLGHARMFTGDTYRDPTSGEMLAPSDAGHVAGRGFSIKGARHTNPHPQRPPACPGPRMAAPWPPIHPPPPPPHVPLMASIRSAMVTVHAHMEVHLLLVRWQLHKDQVTRQVRRALHQGAEIRPLPSSTRRSLNACLPQGLLMQRLPVRQALLCARHAASCITRLPTRSANRSTSIAKVTTSTRPRTFGATVASSASLGATASQQESSRAQSPRSSAHTAFDAKLLRRLLHKTLLEQ